MNKVKEGALFGLGFAVVAITVGYAYSMIIASFYDYDDYGFDQSTEEIEIVESRIVRRQNRLVVLGRYRNGGEKDVSNLKIRADFFGHDDIFLDQCQEYSSGSLAAGAEAYFRLQCSSCADLTLEDVASHKVHIADRF